MPVFAHGGLSSDHSRLHQTASTRFRLRPMNGRRRALPTAGGLPLPSKFSSCPEPSERQPAKYGILSKNGPSYLPGAGAVESVEVSSSKPAILVVSASLASSSNSVSTYQKALIKIARLKRIPLVLGGGGRWTRHRLANRAETFCDLHDILARLDSLH